MATKVKLATKIQFELKITCKFVIFHVAGKKYNKQLATPTIAWYLSQ